MRGYRNDSDGNEPCVSKRTCFVTGDIGCEDADGYFYILDRLKDIDRYRR